MSQNSAANELFIYEARWDELEADVNPFAIMMMAHLKIKATRDDSEDRLQ